MGLQIGPLGRTIKRTDLARPGLQWTLKFHSGKVEMRNRTLLVVLLLVALSAWAQQSNNSSTSASNTSTATENDRPPLASPRPKDFWDGDDPNLVNLITHPFANKKYVQRQVGPIRDRVNELEQVTAENGDRIKDVNSRAQQGIQLASEKSGLADQHASDAANKAQLAQTTANQASTGVSAAEQMVGKLDQYKGTGQTEIRFRPGQTVLSKTAKDALDEMAAPLKDQHGYVVEVRGFAPGQGQTAIRSSQRLADSVVRYLVLNRNIPVYRIHVVSMGNAAVAGGEKRPSGARVELNVLKNDVMTSAQR